ncbi:hypothetical protein PMAYCL1PPCAC_02764 [Pristionchus mayeri]|uniref:Carboxylesterase type B domain-containing protein n=1 Tax=Pristionchus mayeri TaxID=1317129 RepID=A0AAN5C892_9BILA|nr:hypothetical protein PMAYCL1PPCAC_02764 [Pristionchus mayeri]
MPSASSNIPHPCNCPLCFLLLDDILLLSLLLFFQYLFNRLRYDMSTPFLLLFLLSLHSTSAQELSRTISTAWGVVVGELVSPGTNDLPPVTQYLGIPYGSAPVADNRFNYVKSAPKWTHSTKETKVLSPSCVQTQLPELSETKAMKLMSSQRFDFVHRLLPKLKMQSEDCLYMNVFVPERLHSMSKLSVMVIVHGDEYGWGSGGPFNGTTLASFGQIIVVTLNYRLGPFGFLGRCESSSCRGNEGMSDLISALTMLKSTAADFGGDATSVTLMGWGSGAALVSLLMASPITNPSDRLFKRAILLDGTALSPWAMAEDPQGAFLDLAEKLNCVTEESKKSPSALFNGGINQVIKCLQDHSAENITRTVHSIHSPSFLSSFAPIVDGQFVPNKPSVLFTPQYGNLFRDIDLMVGTASFPSHHMMGDEELKNGMSAEKRNKMIRTLVRNLYKFHRNEIMAAILNEYTDWTNPKESSRALRDSILSILSDSLFVAPLIRTLRAHSSDETSRNSKTFFFHFAHETRSWSAEQANSGIRGSFSGDHIPYILGYPLSRKDNDEKLYYGFDADDRGLSRVMMNFVSNFVKSGDPQMPTKMSKQSGMEENFARIAWPQYNQMNREAYLEIGANRENPALVKNYYRNAHVGFWSGLVPQLHAAGKEGVTVPEEHHFLPDYFKTDSFYGHIRPFGGRANLPIPPPPMPPTPPPIVKNPTPSPSSPSSLSPPSSPVYSSYSTMLSLTVAVGCGLLALNICVFFGMYRTCMNNSRGKKKLQLQYQTYSANHGQNPDVQYSINSPLALPPPPPSSNHSQSLMDDVLPPTINGIICGSLPRSNANAHYSRGTASSHVYTSSLPLHHHHHEQEPLLSASQKTSIAGIRAGVSPTCPRHGRTAIANAAASRGNSLASGTLGGSTIGRDPLGSLPPSSVPIEEIQV